MSYIAIWKKNYVKRVGNKPQTFFMRRTVDQLNLMSRQETNMLTGLAKMAGYVYRNGDTADQTIAKLYPKLPPALV